MFTVIRHLVLGVLAVAAFSCATSSVDSTTDRSEMREPAIARRP